jgi:hypothetical protein
VQISGLSSEFSVLLGPPNHVFELVEVVFVDINNVPDNGIGIPDPRDSSPNQLNWLAMAPARRI